MSAGMLRGFRAAAAAFAALALVVACGGNDDAAPPSIADLYAPTDAGMVAWMDAEQAAAYVNEMLDLLPESLSEELGLDGTLNEALGEALNQIAEESGFDFTSISEVMAFASADLDGGAVILEGALVDDFLQIVRDAAGDGEFEEKTHRGVAMIETSDGLFGFGAAVAVVWEGGADGDGPELHIIGTPDEVRAAIDRRADLREGVAAADGDSESDGPAHQALREVGGGWMRFAMAVPDGALSGLTDMLPDEYGGLFSGMDGGLLSGVDGLFSGIDVGVLSGLTLAGFAANRDADGAEQWTLRLEYADADDAERAEDLAEGMIAVSKSLTPDGASLDVLDAMTVSLDGTAVTVVSSATAEQAAALRAEQAEALREQLDALREQVDGLGMAL